MSRGIPTLCNFLEGEALRSSIQAMIDDVTAIAPADAAALIASVKERLGGIAAALRDVCVDDDATEAVSMLPWIVLELRLEWMRYNMQMQYQTLLRGTAEPLLMARGAALSFVLEAVELELDSEAAYVVGKIAADPAGAARGAAQRTDRLIELMTSASAGGRAAVEAMLVAEHHVNRHTDSVAVRSEVGKAISTAIERIGASLRLSAHDFGHAIEGLFLRRLGDAPLRVAIDYVIGDASLTIPSAVANGLLRAASDWMDALRAGSLARDADTRIADGNAAHATITVKLDRRGGRVELSLEDDGDGTVAFAPSREDWPVQDLTWNMSQERGVGTRITFGCYVTGISEYMVLRVGRLESDAMVCVPVNLVERIERRDTSALALHGTRVIDQLTGGTLRMLDLGESLFGEPITADDATYVHLRVYAGDATALALRVREVHGVCRGSLKILPTVLADGPLRGFVQDGGRVIGILDHERLMALGPVDAAAARLIA